MLKDGNIRHTFSTRAKNTLLNLGVPISAFSNTQFSLNECVCKVSANVRMVNARKLSVDRQLCKFNSVYGSILDTNYIAVLSSFPSDTVSRHVALSMLSASYVQFLKHKRERDKRFKFLGPPTWHRIYNTYKSPMIDTKRNCCFLVISGVSSDSTQLKKDKLRDILEAYDHVPRVVVTSSIDPVSFCAESHINANVYLYLGPVDRDVLLV